MAFLIRCPCHLSNGIALFQRRSIVVLLRHGSVFDSRLVRLFSMNLVSHDKKKSERIGGSENVLELDSLQDRDGDIQLDLCSRFYKM